MNNNSNTKKEQPFNQTGKTYEEMRLYLMSGDSDFSADDYFENTSQKYHSKNENLKKHLK